MKKRPSRPRGNAKINTESTETSASRGYWGWITALVFLVIAAHGISLSGGFVWDDNAFVDRWLPRFNSLSAIFFPPTDIPDWPLGYYRPAGVLSLKIDALLWQTWSTGWHATNLLIHGIVTLQVFWLLLVFFDSYPHTRPLAAFGAAVFAVHPIHVESVNWIAGRSDSLATAMTLAVVASTVQFNRTGRFLYLPLIALSLLVGLLCKETTIVAPVLAVVATWVLKAMAIKDGSDRHSENQGPALNVKRRTRVQNLFANRTFLACVALAAALTIYAALRVSAVPSGESGELPDGRLLANAIQASGYYFQQLLVWNPQAPAAPFEIAPSLAISIGFLTTLIVTAGVTFFRLKRRSLPFVYGLMWIVVGMAPSLLVVLLQSDRNTISERYLYLPSVGFCMCLAWLAYQASLKAPAKFVVVGCSAVIALALVGSNAYGYHWRSDASLWSTVVKRYPNHTRAWTILANDYAMQDMQRERLEAAQNAVDSDPDWDEPLINLAIAMRENDRAPEALEAARRATEVSPENPGGWLEYGNALMLLGETDAARKAFAETLQIQPQNAKAYVNLARLNRDDPDRAIELLRTALEIDPNLPMAYNNLGVIFARRNERQKAIRCFRQAVRLDPDLQMAVDNLRAMLSESPR